MTATPGYYLNKSTLNIHTFNGGKFPEGKYVRVPLPLVMILAPVMGLALMMVMPVLGFWAGFRFLANGVSKWYGNHFNASSLRSRNHV